MSNEQAEPETKGVTVKLLAALDLGPEIGFTRTLCETVEKAMKYGLLGECNSMNSIHSKALYSPRWSKLLQARFF